MFRIMLEITFMVVIQCGTKAEITKTAKANMLGSQRLILILILICMNISIFVQRC